MATTRRDPLKDMLHDVNETIEQAVAWGWEWDLDRRLSNELSVLQICMTVEQENRVMQMLDHAKQQLVYAARLAEKESVLRESKLAEEVLDFSLRGSEEAKLREQFRPVAHSLSAVEGYAHHLREMKFDTDQLKGEWRKRLLQGSKVTKAELYELWKQLRILNLSIHQLETHHELVAEFLSKKPTSVEFLVQRHPYWIGGEVAIPSYDTLMTQLFDAKTENAEQFADCVALIRRLYPDEHERSFARIAKQKRGLKISSSEVSRQLRSQRFDELGADRVARERLREQASLPPGQRRSKPSSERQWRFQENLKMLRGEGSSAGESDDDQTLAQHEARKPVTREERRRQVRSDRRRAKEKLWSGEDQPNPINNRDNFDGATDYLERLESEFPIPVPDRLVTLEEIKQELQSGSHFNWNLTNSSSIEFYRYLLGLNVHASMRTPNSDEYVTATDKDIELLYSWIAQGLEGRYAETIERHAPQL